MNLENPAPILPAAREPPSASHGATDNRHSGYWLGLTGAYSYPPKGRRLRLLRHGGLRVPALRHLQSKKDLAGGGGCVQYSGVREIPATAVLIAGPTKMLRLI